MKTYETITVSCGYCVFILDMYTSPETEGPEGDQLPDSCAKECHVPGVMLAYLLFFQQIHVKITFLTRWFDIH